MIVTFRGTRAQQLFHNESVRGLPADIVRRCRLMLKQLNAAAALDDMKIPPGNRLHSLTGKRKGQHAVRINDKWRLVFRWAGGNAFDVEIVDYHDEKH